MKRKITIVCEVETTDDCTNEHLVKELSEELERLFVKFTNRRVLWEKYGKYSRPERHVYHDFLDRQLQKITLLDMLEK